MTICVNDDDDENYKEISDFKGAPPKKNTVFFGNFPQMSGDFFKKKLGCFLGAFRVF